MHGVGRVGTGDGDSVNDDLTLESISPISLELLELPDHSDKTLPEIQGAFRAMLQEAAEHPFRSQLTPQLKELLAYLESLPEVDCAALPAEAYGAVKGWLMQSGVMVGFISGYYDVMSAEA